MAGQSYPDRTVITTQVTELGETPNEISGAVAELTDIH